MEGAFVCQGWLVYASRKRLLGGLGVYPKEGLHCLNESQFPWPTPPQCDAKAAVEVASECAQHAAVAALDWIRAAPQHALAVPLAAWRDTVRMR
jgi:hypothetical protein